MAPCVAAGIPEQWPLSIRPEQFQLADANAAPAPADANAAPATLASVQVDRPYEVLDVERGTPLSALLADLTAFMTPF